MRGYCLLIAAVLSHSFNAAAAEANTAPGFVHSRYAILKSGIEIGEIEELYTRQNGQYTLTSTARPLGILAFFRPGKIFIRSTGVITAQGLQPLEFSYRQEGDTHKNSAAIFAWKPHQLKLNHDDQHLTLALPQGTQDRLSAMYQFMFLNLRDVATLSFAMTNGRKLDNYQYAIAQGETLSTSAGQFVTLYLDSQAQKGETRTQIWLASGQHNLPCKMVITDPDGGKLTQELRSLQIQTDAPTGTQP
jgi:hypothetical protein